MTRSPIAAFAASLALTVSLLPTASCSGAQPGGIPAHLVPSDAVAILQVTSLDSVESHLRAIAGAVDAGAAEAIDLRASLLRELGPGFDPAWIDGTRPLAVAVSLSPSTPLPAVTFIVPATSPDEFAAAVGGRQPPTRVEAHGEYVVWHTDSTAKTAAASEPNPLALDLPRGVIAARVDLARLIETYRGLIEMGLGQAEQMLSMAESPTGPGIDMQAVMSVYVDAARGVIDSAETLELALDVQGSRVKYSQRLLVAEDSSMDGWGAEGPTGIEEVAHLVDPEALVSACIGLDYSALYARVAPVLDTLLAAYPEPLRELMSSYMKSSDSLGKVLGKTQVVSFDLVEGQVRYCFFVSTPDAPALIQEYERMLTLPAMRDAGMEIEGPVEVDIGAGARRYRMKFSPEALARLSGVSGGTPETEALQKKLQGLYGEEGMDVTLAAKDGTVVLVMGGDDAYAEGSVARISSGPTRAPTSLEPALAEVAGQNPCVVAHVDVASIVSAFYELFAAVGGASQPAFQELPAFTLELHAGIADRSWNSGFSWDVGEFGRFSAALKKDQGRQDLVGRTTFEIDLLLAAIASYQADHDGKPPSSLDVLNAPRPNGEPYLEPEDLTPDPWGNPYLYTLEGETYRILSYGSDGMPGGEGAAADIVLAELR